MKYTKVIVILTFLQIFAKSKSVTIPKNSGVLWITEELTSVQTPKAGESHQTDIPLLAKGKELLKIIDEMRDYIENMYADESESSNVPCGNLTEQEVKTGYINYYKKKVTDFMNYVNGNPQPIPFGSSAEKLEIETLESVIRKVEESRRTYSYQPSIKSIHPICNDSSITKEDKFGSNVSILFNFDSLKQPTNMVINVTSATINIYKKGYKDLTNPSPSPNISFNLSYFKGPSLTKNSTIRKGHKYGPTQILRADEERWLQWDMTNIFSKWFRNNTVLTKFWITIKVAADQEHLPAFFTINCSKITALNDGGRNAAMGIDKEVPFMNVTVKEVSKRDMEFYKKEQKLVDEVNAVKQSIITGSDYSNGAEHRTKQDKKNKNAEVTDSTLDTSEDST